MRTAAACSLVKAAAKDAPSPVRSRVQPRPERAAPPGLPENAIEHNAYLAGLPSGTATQGWSQSEPEVLAIVQAAKHAPAAATAPPIP